MTIQCARETASNFKPFLQVSVHYLTSFDKSLRTTSEILAPKQYVTFNFLKYFKENFKIFSLETQQDPIRPFGTGKHMYYYVHIFLRDYQILIDQEETGRYDKNHGTN